MFAEYVLICAFYHKHLKFSDKENCCNYLENYTMCFLHKVMRPNDAVRISNIDESDQTAYDCSGPSFKLTIISV